MRTSHSRCFTGILRRVTAAAAILAAARCSNAELPTEPVQIGRQPQYVFDNWIVDNHWAIHYKTEAIRRVLHPPVKYAGNPVIAGRGGYVNVDRDAETGLFRMWYQASRPSPVKGRSGETALAYAESSDGITWTLPEFTAFEFGGTRKNNIVYHGFRNRSIGGPFLLDVPQADRHGYRFLLTYNGVGGLRLIGSQDGIHWDADNDTAIVPIHSDTQNAFVYDSSRRKYVWFGRAKHIYRTFRGDVLDTGASRRVARAENTELWTEWNVSPQQILIPDELDTRERFNFFYGMPTVYRDGIYWGFLQPFRMNTLIHSELAWSRDGVDFHRLPERPKLIELGPEGSWDDSMVFGSARWIEMGDEWWLYYAGWDGPHESRDRTPGIGLMKMRKEGFISLRGPRRGGALVTRQIVWPGGDLILNANASQGKLNVRISDERRKIIDGFDYTDADPTSANDVNHVFRWKGRSLNEMQGRTIRLEIYLENADLYTFRAGQSPAEKKTPQS